MTNSPLISIVVPVYNSAKDISRSLESILAQTYREIEIIVLDDASTDDSWTIIQEYARSDDRIKAYSIPFVEGPKVARDNAIRRAAGEWIIPIDSDDTIEPNYVEKLWTRHLETDADFVGAKMVLVDENGNGKGCTIPVDGFDYSVIYSGTEAMLRVLSYWQFGAAGALWNRTVMTNISPEEAKYGYADEYDTRVYLNNCKTVAFVDAYYYYTQNPSSCTHTKTIHSLTYILFNKIKLKEYFDEKYGINCALSEYYSKAVVQEYKQCFSRLFSFCIRSKVKLSDDFLTMLTKAYSIFRQEQIKSHFFLVQLYRFLWAILRKVC